MNDRSERVILTNMCMITKNESVLALDKVGGGYTGITFPGGHIESGESFHDSVIREVREETGLEIRNPEFTGVYQWQCDGVRNILFLYRADEFEGELRSSDEGRVFWTELKEYENMELAPGMHDVLQIMQSGTSECFADIMQGRSWLY